MKTCPQCKASCAESDNICGKCTYHFPIDEKTAAKVEIENEYKAITLGHYPNFNIKKRIVLSIISLPIFVLGLLVFAVYESWALFLVFSILFTLQIITVAFGIKRSRMEGKLPQYVPLKGFGFYRKSSEQKIKLFKIRQKVSLLLALATVLYVINPFIAKSISCYITAIYVLFILLVYALDSRGKKTRIKFHEPIDDANYFELEELGLITEKDVVISLYKDFASWKEVKENSKLLILTQDALVCLNFKERTRANKLVIPLKEITGLGFNSEISAVFMALEVAGSTIRLYLKGENIQDSPEEFISRFLKQLDNYILNRPHGEPKTYNRSQFTPPSESQNLRQLDITDCMGCIASVESNTSRLIEY